jgi:hypothetical protein
MSIDDHHFAVEMLKRASSEIAVLAQCADSYGALVDPLDEGGGGRDLIPRVVRDLEVLRKSLADDVRERLFRPLGIVEQGPPKAW